MSKQKPSKLDAYAERLDEWFGIEKKTLDEVREQLLLDGVTVSCSRLSSWWGNRQTERMQEQLLSQIATRARACAEVEEAFTRHSAPELDILVKLHRVLI